MRAEKMWIRSSLVAGKPGSVAGSMTAARPLSAGMSLVAGNFRVDGAGPGVDSSGEGLDMGEALIA
jgi:hypothetical protein